MAPFNVSAANRRFNVRGGVLQHLVFHSVHHRFGNDIIAGRKFQFQLLNGLVGGKRVLEGVVIVLVLPLGVCQLVADTVNGNCHVAGGGAVSEVIVHVEFQQKQIIDRLIECDRYRDVRFVVHIILAVTNGGDLFVTVCRGSIGRGDLMNACQTERDQVQNRATCIKMLKAKLLELRERAKEEEMANIKGEMKKIEWGSQIRSYVFQPYTMVKDHRTNYESGNIDDVMDGNLEGFITAYLKMQ